MMCRCCEREFPAELICEFETGFVGGESVVLKVCPLCAYKVMNTERGLPLDTPPPKTAPVARQKYLAALEYVKGKDR